MNTIAILVVVMLAFATVYALSVILTFFDKRSDAIEKGQEIVNIKEVLKDSFLLHGVTLSIGAFACGLALSVLTMFSGDNPILFLYVSSALIYLMLISLLEYTFSDLIYSFGKGFYYFLVTASILLTLGYQVFPDLWFRLALLIFILVVQARPIWQDYGTDVGGFLRTFLEERTINIILYLPAIMPFVFVLTSIFKLL